MALKQAGGKQPHATNSNSAHSAADYDTLPCEQIRNEPLPQGGGFEKMARRRYQKPTPKKRGEQWCILLREDIVADGLEHFDAERFWPAHPLDEGIRVTVVFHLGFSVRCRAQMLFPMWATQGCLQPFRFLDLSEASRAGLNRELENLVRAGASQEEEEAE